MTTNNELKLHDKNVVLDYIKKTTKIKHRDRKQKIDRMVQIVDMYLNNILYITYPI